MNDLKTEEMSSFLQQNEFHLNVTVKEEKQTDDGTVQTVNVELLGIKGSIPSDAGYFIACWSGDDPGQHENVYDAKMITNDLELSWNETFSDLNLSQYNYTFVLGVGGISYNEQTGLHTKNGHSYYPVTVTVSSTSKETYKSDNPARISIVAQDRSKVIVQCHYPNGNSAHENPQFVVLAEGTISDFENATKLAQSQIQSVNKSFDIPSNLRRGFNIGTTYVLAYVMGDNNGNPDLDRVVGSTEFIAKRS